METIRRNRLMKRFKSIMSLTLVLILGLGGILIPNQEAYARLIFTTESEGVNSEAYHLDNDDSSAQYIDLAFGSTLGATLQYDKIASKFLFNHSVSLSGNELLDFKVENLATASAPTCDSGAQGRLYYDTDTKKMLFCNGTGWTDSADLDSGSVTTTEIENGTILEEDLADQSVTSAKIALNTIVADDIATGAVETTEILDGTILEEDLADQSVTSAKIALNTIVADDIATSAVTTDEILDSTIIADDIAADTITADEIATSAVTTDEILDGTISFDDIEIRTVDTTFTPEYPNFTLNADGTNNTGTLEADLDGTTTPARNFYKWSTLNDTTAQDYDIVVQWAVPENFQAFTTAGNQIELDIKTNTINLADNKIDVTLFDTAGAEATLTGGTDLKSTVADTWETAGITFSGGTFTPGQYVTLKIKMTSKDENAAFVGALKFKHKVK